MTGSPLHNVTAMQMACLLVIGTSMPLISQATTERPMSALNGMVSIEASPCGARAIGQQTCMNLERPGAFIKFEITDATDPVKVVSVTTDQAGAFHLVLPIGRYKIALHHDMLNLLMPEQEIALAAGSSRRLGLTIKALAP